MIKITKEERLAIRKLHYYENIIVKKHKECRLLDALEEAEYNLEVWEKRWQRLDEYFLLENTHWILKELEEEFLLEGEQND